MGVKMNKILFADLDGTLLTEKKEISPFTRQTLAAWTGAGNKLVLCSGRPLVSIREVKESLSLSYPGMYLIGFNGGCIYECDTGRILHKTGLSKEQCRHILQSAAEAGIYCHTYSDTDILSPLDGRELSFYRRTIHLPARFAVDTASLAEMIESPPCKCLAIELDDHAKLERFRRSLLPWAEGQCTLVYSNAYLLEIFPADSGKGTAVKTLCALLELPVQNACAAGDQENDISMIQAAGTGIAMLNAPETVKKAADVITMYDNDHDGLAMLLAEYL